MAHLDAFRFQWSQRLLSVLRVVSAFLFTAHGAQKLFGFLAPPGHLPPSAFSLLWVAAVLEFFGGLALLIGLFTRPVAFVLSGEMAIAYFMIHAPNGFWPLQNKGEGAVLYAFVFLYLVAAGGGPWSIDRLWGRLSMMGNRGESA